MKKIIAVLMAAVLCTCLFAGCGEGAEETNKVIKIGASVTPHAEILREAAKVMEKEGWALEIQEFNDYVIPNTSTESGELDANFFQHQPYLTNFNEENGTHLIAVCAVHYEPFGIYAGKTKSLADIEDGAIIAVPNDGTNEARALKLLEAEGLIKLKEDAGFTATKLDIVENPHNIDIQEIDAAQSARALSDVDFAVINGNYAIQAGFNAAKDALATESKDSEAAVTYANVLVVKEGNENSEGIKLLAQALQSDEVKTFMENKYDGAVVPMF